MAVSEKTLDAPHGHRDRGSTLPARLSSADYMPTTVDILAERECLNEDVELHWHDFYKLVYVADGAGTHVFNGVSFPITAGDAFVLTPSDLHAWQPDGECVLYNLLFSPRVLSEYLESVLFRDAGMRLGPLIARDMSKLRPILDTMVLESDSRGPDARLSLECLLQHVLVEFARNAHAEEPTGIRTRSGIHDGVRRALMYVEQHYRDPLTLELAAATAHLSPNYFSQLFHEVVGIPFQEHLQMLRVRFARSLALATDMSVTDICHASGFQTLSHFERTFKAHYGQSPSACRRTARADAERHDHDDHRHAS
jgi:AraC-like DNA-binding protein